MAANDDDEIEVDHESEEPGDPEDELEEPEPELDEAELDEEALEEEVLDTGDDEFEGDEVEDEAEEDDAEESETAVRARKRKGVAPGAEEEEEDDDDDLIAPDDVEADLDRILKDRMVASDEEEDEDEEAVVDDRGEAVDGLQPKRADETLCSSCFLLVRPNAPGCPVEDDRCPIF